MKTKTKISFFAADNIIEKGLRAILTPNKGFIIGDNFNNIEKLKAKNNNEIIIYQQQADLNVIINQLSELRLNTNCRIVFLLFTFDKTLICKLLKLGIENILSISSIDNSIIDCVLAAKNKKSYTCEIVQNKMIGTMYPSNKKNILNHDLTKRETEILQLIVDEFTSIEIAQKLKISPSTIEAHRKRITEKIGAKNIVGVVKYGLENQIDK